MLNLFNKTDDFVKSDKNSFDKTYDFVKNNEFT